MRPFDPEKAALWPVATGCDEVGRGALCGPVVAAAVWFDPAALPPALLAGLDDSKRLTPLARRRLAAAIGPHARAALAARSAAAVDRLGIRAASLAAMRDAVLRLAAAGPAPGPVLVDGRDAPPGIEATAIVGGDRRVPQIAAASIVAKVARDALMARLSRRHPAYGWERNAGYGVAAHMAALAAAGPCRHHRQSFAPVARRAAGDG